MKLKYDKPAFLPTLRELVRCNQSFERFSGAHVRMLGLTPPQFDVIATLGNTEGMSCKELGEKTLITKGTLTGVLDRLEQRRLIERREDAADARRTQIALTPAGESLFVQVFPAHLAHLERAFSRLSGAELKQLQTGLAALHHALDKSIAVMNAD